MSVFSTINRYVEKSIVGVSGNLLPKQCGGRSRCLSLFILLGPLGRFVDTISSLWQLMAGFDVSLKEYGWCNYKLPPDDDGLNYARFRIFAYSKFLQWL